VTTNEAPCDRRLLRRRRAKKRSDALPKRMERQDGSEWSVDAIDKETKPNFANAVDV
jgi:hypothetical protein